MLQANVSFIHKYLKENFGNSDLHNALFPIFRRKRISVAKLMLAVLHNQNFAGTVEYVYTF